MEDVSAKVMKGAAGWRARKGPQAENKSGFRAVGHNVLLLPDETKKYSEGGIELIEKTVEAEKNHAVWAVVVEIGPGCWGDQVADYADVGDRVLVGQYTGKFHESPVDGKTYRFLKDLDVISPLVDVEA